MYVRLIHQVTEPEHMSWKPTANCLRELQLRISKGKMNKKDFSLLHFSKYKGETKLKRMTLNSKGIFKTPFPEDFFDTTLPAAKQLTESNMN